MRVPKTLDFHGMISEDAYFEMIVAALHRSAMPGADVQWNVKLDSPAARAGTASYQACRISGTLNFSTDAFVHFGDETRRSRSGPGYMDLGTGAGKADVEEAPLLNHIIRCRIWSGNPTFIDAEHDDDLKLPAFRAMKRA
jgi:hypothetical protein